MLSRWWEWYWPTWLIVTLVTLMGPEIAALVSQHPDDTLSEWVWRQLQVTTGQQLPWTAAHYLVFGSWLTVVSWLTWHFFFRRFT
jgi:hypothetical protein